MWVWPGAIFLGLESNMMYEDPPWRWVNKVGSLPPPIFSLEQGTCFTHFALLHIGQYSKRSKPTYIYLDFLNCFLVQSCTCDLRVALSTFSDQKIIHIHSIPHPAKMTLYNSDRAYEPHANLSRQPTLRITTLKQWQNNTTYISYYKKHFPCRPDFSSRWQ